LFVTLIYFLLFSSVTSYLFAVDFWRHHCWALSAVALLLMSMFFMITQYAFLYLDWTVYNRPTIIYLLIHHTTRYFSHVI
jgi:hypothetical protein